MRKEILDGYLEYRLPEIPEMFKLSRLLKLREITGREEEVVEKFIVEGFQDYIVEVNFDGKTSYAEVLKDLSCLNILVDLCKEFFDAIKDVQDKKKERSLN